jgi:pimeloyl-ACP methyl ester carboxylesterase
MAADRDAGRALSAERGSELGALARLAFSEMAAGVGGIGLTQRGISERVFRSIGPSAFVARWAHDSISGAVFSVLRRSTRALGSAAEGVLWATGAAGREISAAPGGATLVGAINGLIGDQLEREASELHQPMAVRVGGRAVRAERPALAEAFPAASANIVVFLHGLMETEFAWSLRERRTGDTYGSRLSRDLGCTPVYVRYNTGRHVSENGLELSELLEEVVAAWPVEVDGIALVGHSMGGLVARSACYQAKEEGAAWVDRVRHVVSLGTPHMGAPLAQGVHYAAAAFHALPETRALALLLRRRSAGIRDLRQGSLVDEDWRGRDPDALRAAACREVPLLDGATHCFVAATLTGDKRHPIARLLGDTLVLVPSASGRSRTRRIPFSSEYGAHVGGTHHLALLNHPRVYECLRGWLATPPATLAPPGRP